MIAVKCSIDMRWLPGCGAEEILVERTGFHTYWCRAAKAGRKADLGPVVFDVTGGFSELWRPQLKGLIGSEENLKAFFTALEVFLRQRQVIA